MTPAPAGTAVTRTVMDVEDELSAEPQQHFGTPTRVATVNKSVLPGTAD